MVQYALPLTGVVAVEIVVRKRRRRVIVRADLARHRITVGRLDLYELSGGECVRLPGPCIHVACRHNLAVVERTEQYTKTTPRTPTESQCSIREAADGAMTGARVAGILGLCEERVRQIELGALSELAARAPELRDVLEAALSRPDGATYPEAPAGADDDEGDGRIAPTRWR